MSSRLLRPGEVRPSFSRGERCASTFVVDGVGEFGPVNASTPFFYASRPMPWSAASCVHDRGVMDTTTPVDIVYEAQLLSSRAIMVTCWQREIGSNNHPPVIMDGIRSVELPLMYDGSPRQKLSGVAA